jgi:hypothetical protein
MKHWTNPLLLPVLIVENYSLRSNLFAQDLDDQMVALERQTGVVFAARKVHSEEKAIRPEHLPRDKIHNLTQDMHTLLTEIIHFQRCADWILDFTNWIKTVGKEIEDFDMSERQSLVEQREVIEFVEFMASEALGRVGIQKSLRERIQSQINVVS